MSSGTNDEPAGDRGPLQPWEERADWAAGLGGALLAAAVCVLLLLFLNYIWFHVNRLTFDVGEVEYEHTLFGIGVQKRFDPSLVASVERERDQSDTREVLWDVPLVLLEQKPSGLAYKKRPMLMRGLARETAEAVSSQLRWADLDIPVSGSRARGTLHVQANKKDGR